MAPIIDCCWVGAVPSSYCRSLNGYIAKLCVIGVLYEITILHRRASFFRHPTVGFKVLNEDFGSPSLQNLDFIIVIR